MSEATTWVGVTVAISLVIIAASFAAIAVATLLAVRRVADTLKSLNAKLGDLRESVDPAIKTINSVAAKAEVAGEKALTEFDSVLDTSRQLRWRLVKGANRIEQRLTDLDALYEVVSTEVENTALDVASMVRSVRNGSSVMGRIRRMLLPRRR
jgi:uncharacterized protein YoxC